jgi:hypothetical protein
MEETGGPGENNLPQSELQPEGTVKKAVKKREKKRLEPHNSLNVACLKRSEKTTNL